MFECFLLLSALLVCANAYTLQELSHAEWTAFKLQHNKQYEDAFEERFRYQIFNENRLIIAKHNQLYAQGKVSYELGINQFADMLHEEFLEFLGNYISPPPLKKPHVRETVRLMPSGSLPEAIDWRAKGAVTPVKSQGACGDGWAFATTGALEGLNFNKHGSLIALSEQNLVDCSDEFGNNGCSNGSVENAFAYIYYNQGINTEASYPYRGEQGKCRYNSEALGCSFNLLLEIKTGDEHHLESTVATYGPATAAIDASSRHFMLYKSGVFYEPNNCDSNKLNHVVLVVGYDTVKRAVNDTVYSQDYWLVKNSWGTTWGNEGYIQMSRNKDNRCGIASKASLPLF